MWQPGRAEQLVARAHRLPAVATARLYGSVTTPGLLDRWSDVDLALELTAPLPLAELVDDVWAYEDHPGDPQVVRLIDTAGRQIDLSVGGAAIVELPEIDTNVNAVRFALASAPAKQGRGDRLIASHLALGAARVCLVEAMLLRDRDTGTTVHRFGTHRDGAAAPIMACLDPLDLRGLAAAFDRVHGERDPAYVADWAPLEARLG